MSMTHEDFRQLKEEIESAIVDKTIRALTNKFLKWSSIIFATVSIAISYGGWFFVSNSIGEEVAKQLSPKIERLDDLSNDLVVERVKLQVATTNFDNVRSDFETFQEQLSEITSSYEAIIEESNFLVGQLNLNRDHTSAMVPIVLHTRDQLLGQTAGFRTRTLVEFPTLDDGLKIDASLMTAPPNRDRFWGQRKIVILRETPGVARGDKLNETQVLYNEKIRDLSSRMRVAFAVMGYEVDEWDVASHKVRQTIRRLFNREMNVLDKMVDQPAVFGHAEFQMDGSSIESVLRYLSESERLWGVDSLISADFTPDSGFLSSFNGGRNNRLAFDPTEILVIFLPWEVAPQV